jgi:hypothetical protein
VTASTHMGRGRHRRCEAPMAPTSELCAQRSWQPPWAGVFYWGIASLLLVRLFGIRLQAFGAVF